MKILELPAYFYPERMSSSHLDDNLREALANAEIEMAIYCPTPTRSITLEERRVYRKKKLEKMYSGMATVHRFSLYGEGKNPILRALRYTLACIMQFNRALFAKDARSCDVMFITSTPPIKGAMAGIAKKFNRKPIVYNLQDIFPDSLVGSGLAKKGSLLWKIGRVIENFTYRNADKIIVISQDFKRNIMAKGVPEEKIVVIYNWVDEKTVQPLAKEDNPLFEEFGLSREKFIIVYAGNLGNAQNISIILQAAKLLKDDDLNDDDNLDNNQMVGSDEKKVNNNFNHNQGIQFVIFGTGGLEEELRRTIEKEHLDNVRLLPLQPYERVSQVYSLGDACIVSCKEGLGGSAMPSKTWTIMSCGRPVIASFDEGELKDIVEGKVDGNLDLNLDDNDNQDNNFNLDLGVDENLDLNGNLDLCDNKNVGAKPCGIFTKAGDKEAFKEAILKLYRNPELCKEYGRNGRQFILQNLTKEVGTRKYVEVIKSVAEEKRR